VFYPKAYSTFLKEEYNIMKVLIIDDESIVRKNFAAFLEDHNYEALESENGKEGLEMFRQENPDIVLCDLKMPVLDGLDFIRELTKESPETPIIMISGTGDIDDVIEAIRLGAWDYITKPIYDMGVLEHALNKAIERANLLRENRQYREHLESEVKKRTQKILERTQELQQANERLNKEIMERKTIETMLKNSLTSLEKTIEGSINTISSIIEMRDPYTGGHQRHVADLCRAIAMEMGFSSNPVQGIYYASLIHDIGKLAVPLEVLVKPGPISKIEMMLIKVHPQAGWEMLRKIEFPWPIAQIALQHHERMDGSGYPSGLTGDQILDESKIVAVADVVESMTFHRPYREALGIEMALQEIINNKGILYHADSVDACVKLFRENNFKFE
jgi:putative two-component system response regulator